MGTEKSKVKVLGYSERGMINSIVFFLREQPQHIKKFLIETLGIEDKEDFFNDSCDYTFLNEQSFSDFGSSDWIIVAKKDNVKRVIFIEAKRGKSYKIEEEFKKINDYYKEGKEYKGISSNIFAQLYYKYILTLTEIDSKIYRYKESKIGKTIKSLGGNDVVNDAYKKYIKSASKFYYVAILPKEFEIFSEKFDELELGIPKDYIKSVCWEKIKDFFEPILIEGQKNQVTENFIYNEGQIY